MFYGLSHVDVPVQDLGRARKLYRDVLGFEVVHEAEGFMDLDTSTAILRLIASPRVTRTVTLRMQAPDVPAAVRRLADAGCKIVYEPSRTEQLTYEATVRDGDGHTVIVWRDLSEDEYGFDPDLATEIRWDADAEALMKDLLKSVPALFRGLARRKVVKEAEFRAGTNARVSRDLAIRSFISAQAPVNRKRLHEPLRQRGIDPADYADEFAS